jgi:YidC/Oxa1 family membrane protein insertase
MHPDDKRNMAIFAVACIVLFLAYDFLFYQPKMEAMRAAQEAARLNPTPALEQGTLNALPKTRDDAAAAGNRITIETDTVVGSLNTIGARIDDLSLKNYMTEPEGDEMVNLLNPLNGPYAYYGEFGWLSNDQSIPMPGKNSEWRADSNSLGANETVSLTWNNGQGLQFRNEVNLDERYMFSVNQTVQNNSEKAVTLYPFALIGRDGLPETMTGAFILHEGPIGYVGDELFEIDYDDLDDGKTTTARANEGWIGMTDKYWLAALTTGKDYTEEVKFRFTGSPKSNGVTLYQTDMMGAAVTLQPGDQITVPIEFFAGPKIVNLLSKYSAGDKDGLWSRFKSLFVNDYSNENLHDTNFPHFDLAVDFGVLYILTRPFYEILSVLNGLFGNFAVALLVFTVLIKLCVFPLAQKSYRSFARMRKVTPQMIEIREKYGDDRVKLQQAIFELYKKENVNPMAGCVPILIQIPIMFALYKVFYVNIGMRHEPFWGWINDMSAMDPTNLFTLFGLIPWDPPSILHIGAWPIIMGCTMALQQRLSPPPQDQTQKIIFSIMPIWLTIILAKFPAGLVIYWSWSNTLSILQQYLLLRQEGVKVNIFTRTRSEKRLEEMVEDGPAVHPEMEILDHEDIEPETKEVKPRKRKKKK